MKVKSNFCLRYRTRQTRHGGAKDAEQAECQKPAPDDTSATALSAYMKRFLSIVEHELDAEELEVTGDDDGEKSEEEKQHKLTATTIVAVEVKTTRQTEDDDRGADKEKDAAEGGDDNDDESGSRLVTIDKTRLMPQVDVDNFIS